MSFFTSSRYIFVTICLLMMPSDAERKSRKIRDTTGLLPNYNLHKNEELPRDRQISTFASKGETQSFFYKSLMDTAPLSITVLTCSSPLNWTMVFQPNSSSEAQPGSPQTLQNAHMGSTLKLLRRQQRRKLTVRWQPSLVDPQVTDYCLVVSSKKHYTTLCSAIGDKYGIIPPLSQNQPEPASHTVTAWDGEVKKDKTINPMEPLITCVGPKTHFTLSDLKQNNGYYFNLFAINRQSNLTYHYGSNFTIYDKRNKPIRLKDGKPIHVSLKKFDGKVIFKYRVMRPTSDSLKIHVMPCGGSVDVEVLVKRESIIKRMRIEGYGRLVIPQLKLGDRYRIKILSSNREELRKTSGLEVLATSKPSSKIPLPDMPTELSVTEFSSLRKCDSVTIGWLVSPSSKIVRYCLTVKEGRLKENESIKISNQCKLASRLKKSTEFTTKYCRDAKPDKEKVITQKIAQLKPGIYYIVQVTAKKAKGKTLSYDLLQTQTLHNCSS